MSVSPFSVTFGALAVGGILALGHLLLSPQSDQTPAATARDVEGAPSLMEPLSSAAAPAAAADSRAISPDATAVPTTGDVARWSLAARGEDVAARTDAIWKLGSATIAEALPVLRQVVRSGTVEDRDIALAAIGTLAREHGDAEGVIRDVLRETIYHGDDDDVLFTARATLDDVENQLSAPLTAGRKF